MKHVLTYAIVAISVCALAGNALAAPADTRPATPVPLSTTATVIKNDFVLDPNGEYFLYAYDSARLGYVDMEFYHYAQGIEPRREAVQAVAAINALPVLEKIAAKPSGSPKYGLMTVSADGSYTKNQFFLYKDILTVNGTAYRIDAKQYSSLKAVMEKGATLNRPIPQWLLYMNPDRVTGILCTDTNGKMRKMKKSNIGYAATDLRYIYVKSAKTYKLGSKDLDKLPFKAVYTFDNGVLYTVYVSNTTQRVDGVTIYVQSSDMSYGCEYVVDGFISSYVDSTQGMIDGPANPRTM